MRALDFFLLTSLYLLEVLGSPPLATGQAGGAFNRALPVDWMLTVVLELIHAATREVSAGRLPDEAAERALLTTVTGALSPAS